jgi:CubicO group peptidase (beta-lactamase class C family)
MITASIKATIYLFMISRTLCLALTLVAFLAAGIPASAAPPVGSAPLDRFILARMQWSHIPGLSAVVVKNGAIVWRGAYGFRDAAAAHPVTPDTLFELASVSKTVLAVAVLQLVEQGKLALDGDVNAALPFRVRNPNFPERPITPRMLLGHVSGIVDNWPVIEAHSVENTDAPVSLSDWFRGYLTAGGGWYSKEANFSRNPPGTAFTYSNQAAALSALAVEGASGEPFDRYCRGHIFAPLGMSESSYRLTGLDPSHIAMPQAWRGGRFVELGHHGFPDYPAGTLRTSAPQLARFLLMVMNGGEYRGVRLLAPATVRQMLTPQYPWLDSAIDLLWFNLWQGGEVLIGYEGEDPGVNTLMYFRPKDRAGVIVLANGSSRLPAIRLIAARLFEEAAHL